MSRSDPTAVAGAAHPLLLMSLEDKVSPQHAAIVVIDVQNDFIAPGGFADTVGWNRRHAMLAARRLGPWLEIARKSSIPILFVRSIYDPEHFGPPMVERNRRRGLEVPRCRSGTWGADFYLVRPETADPIVTKHRLSAFFETDLDDRLRQRDIRSILLTGVYTEACVESTARHAYFLDYYVVMISDLTASTHLAYHRAALAGCERDFGVVASAADVASAWKVA